MNVKSEIIIEHF